MCKNGAEEFHQNLVIHSLVPKNLHTPPPERKLEIPWVKGWVSRTKPVNEIYKPLLEFPEGGGSQKKSLRRGMDIF